MASIKKRPDGRWRARYRDPQNKEHAQHFATRAAAQRWIDAETAKLVRGDWTEPKRARITLRDYSDEWLTRMRPSWRPRTDHVVTISLEKHILPVLGDRALATIRRSDVEALYVALKLAPGTVALVAQHLGQVLTAAAEVGLIARSPAVRAKRPRFDAVKTQPVPPEVVSSIDAALPEWLRIVVPLGVGAGMRQSEVCGLTVDRIDFLRRTLRVDRQLLNGRMVPPKTASSARTIPLPEFVVDALAAHLAHFSREPGELILLDDHRQALLSRRFSRLWCRATEEVGTDVRFHDLRHTFASTLLSRGVSIKAVADWLGHASPTITLSTYAHLMPTDDEVGRSVLDAAFADSSRTVGSAHG